MSKVCGSLFAGKLTGKYFLKGAEMYLKQPDATSGNEEKKRSVYKRKDKQDIMKCTSQFGLQKPLGNLNTGLLT